MSVWNMASKNAEDFESCLRVAADEECPFVAGTGGALGFPLSGYPAPVGYHGNLGYLSDEWKPMVAEANYVIFSYGTLVAFRSAGVWSVPDQTHPVAKSQTTDRYVARVRAAFDVVRQKPGT